MANLNLNKVVLCGRLTADPELKQTQSGISVVSFTLAVNRRYVKQSDDQSQQQQQLTDFINVVAWRNTAEFISRYFHKGSCLCVTGSIQTRKWTDQQGQNRYSTEVVVDEAMFVDSKGENGASSAPAYNGSGAADSYSAPSFSTPQAAAPKFEEMSNDDDLPF